MPFPRWARRALIAVAVVVAVILAAAVALPFLIDVDRYRPLLVERVQKATGRRVSLGQVSFSLLPAPGIVARDLRVASAAAPGKTVDLMVKEASIQVGLLPLLRGRMVVRSIVLDEPGLVLHRDARGVWNFGDLFARADEDAPPEAAPAGEPLTVAVERAVVRSGKLMIYDDAVVPGTRTRAQIEPVGAEIRGWGEGETTSLDLTAGLGESSLEVRGTMTPRRGAAPLLEMTAGGKAIRAADLVTLLPWAGFTPPAGLALGGALDLRGEAAFPADHPEAMRFAGTLRLRDVSYRDASMARPLEGIGGDVVVDKGRAVWRDFSARIGGSALTGSLQVEGFARPRVGFAFTSDRIDFNEIVGAFGPAAAHAAPAGAAAEGAPESAGIPLLDRVTGNGTLAATAMRFQNFDLGNVKGEVGLAGGVFRLRSMEAGFYDGALRGSAEVNLGAPRPRYGTGVRLEKVDVDPLLKAYDPALGGLLRGRLTGSLDLSAAGVDMEPILGSASGTGAIEIRDGVLTSFSVLKQLAALIELAGGRGIGRDETPFEFLRASLAISDRRARTDDLLLRSADLDLEARGWVGLDGTLDLDAIARFSPESTRDMVAKTARLERLTVDGRLVVYFSLSGKLASPTFKLNTRALLDQTRTETRERAKERLRDRLHEKILERLGGGGEEPAPSPSPSAPPR